MMNHTQTLTGYLKGMAHSVPRDALDQQHIIVCANIQQTQLYADWLISEKNHHCHTWIQPQVLSLNQWLEQLYIDQIATQHCIISHNQQVLRWYQIIGSMHTPTMRALSWQLAKQYHHYYQHESQFGHDEHTELDEKYRHCKQAYIDQLQSSGLIDHATLEKSFSEWCRELPPTHVSFIGFNVLTTSLKNLIDHIPSQQLFVVAHLDDHSEKKAIERVYAFDREDQQIDYITQRLNQHLDSEDATRIGLILPRHSDYSRIITPVLERMLCQQSPHLSTPGQNRLFTTLIPRPIAEHVMVQSLNHLLFFFDQPSVERLDAIFRQPMLHHKDIPTSAYHAALNQISHLSITQVLDAHFCMDQLCHEAARAWTHIQVFLQYAPIQQCTHSEWTKWIKTLLSKSLQPHLFQDAAETKLFHLWLESIQRCEALLMSRSAQLSYREWLDLMTLSLSNTYAPTSEAACSQFVVMSWSHALDMPFDELIFISNHAGNWPASIAADFQQGGEERFWQQIIKQLQSSCQQMTYLYPQHDNQMQPMLPSPLVPTRSEHIHSTPVSQRPHHLLPRQTVRQKIPISGPLLTTSEQTISTSVIQSYSRCHAQGFFQHRLHIRPMEHKRYGIDALDLGNLVHALLQSLDDITTPDIPDDTSIQRSITSILQSTTIYRQLTQIQKASLFAHLEQVIRNWLAYRVQAHHDDAPISSRHEVVMKKSMFGVHFNIRIDRLDQFADGSYRIVDYKTGLVNRADWLSSRPQNPQLIIYALSTPSTRSIAYACLHPDHFGYHGYGDDSETLLGIKPISKIALSSIDTPIKTMNSWPQQIAIWQATIADLVTAYQSASMRLNPADGSMTCNLCQLHAVCRIYEKSSTSEVINHA